MPALPGRVPSDFVPHDEAEACAAYVKARFAMAGIGHFVVRVRDAGEYPPQLRHTARPVELVY